MVAFPGVAQMRSHPRRDTSWQEFIACRDANPRIFFEPERYAEALLVCAECPVKVQCRDSRGSSEGVWGGKVYGRPPGRPRRRT